MNDEQRKAFEKWVVENTPFTEPRKYNSGLYEQQIHHFLWQVWQAAQQIKPLEWQSRHAYTVFGTYYVSFRVTTETYSAWRNGESIVDESFETEAEAIEAANADYQRRVLSCLVHGGV